MNPKTRNTFALTYKGFKIMTEGWPSIMVPIALCVFAARYWLLK